MVGQRPHRRHRATRHQLPEETGGGRVMPRIDHQQRVPSARHRSPRPRWRRRRRNRPEAAVPVADTTWGSHQAHRHFADPVGVRQDTDTEVGRSAVVIGGLDQQRTGQSEHRLASPRKTEHDSSLEHHLDWVAVETSSRLDRGNDLGLGVTGQFDGGVEQGRAVVPHHQSQEVIVVGATLPEPGAPGQGTAHHIGHRRMTPPESLRPRRPPDPEVSRKLIQVGGEVRLPGSQPLAALHPVLTQVEHGHHRAHRAEEGKARVDEQGHRPTDQQGGEDHGPPEPRVPGRLRLPLWRCHPELRLSGKASRRAIEDPRSRPARRCGGCSRHAVSPA